MADTKTNGNSNDNTTKVAGAAAGESSGFQVEPGMMSLEELDSVISSADPEALQKIEGVREIAPADGANIEILEFDEYLNEAKETKLHKLKGKGLILWMWAKNRSIENAKRFAYWSLDTAKAGQKSFGEGLKAFKEWSWPQKLMLLAGVLVLAAAVAFAYFAFVKKAFNHKEELFPSSLLTMADHVYNVKPEEAMETFYNSSRIPKNIFSLKRLVVNIKPSESSGPNPMVAYEFSLEGNSTEVLIEIKDREGEIIDQVQRTIEDHSFDELNSVEGKKMIVDKVRSTVNRLLTLGKIRYVYIQGVVFKP